MAGAAQALEGAWTDPGPAPETISLMAGPAATTRLLQPGGPAAPGVLMRTAAEEEGAGAEPTAINHQATLSMSQDRNQELEGTTATTTTALALAQVSSSESSTCETEVFFCFFLKSTISTSELTGSCDML